MVDRLRDVVSKVLGVPAEDLADSTSPDTVDGWDSIKNMNLVLALEDEFEIEFSDEQLDSMLNFELIALAVQEATADA